jgi:MFS family permease
MSLIDRYGRKSLLLSAETLMAIFAILIPILDNWKIDPIYIVVSLLLFVFGFGLGLGSIPWLIVPEIIPLHALDVSSSICSGMNWAFNFILALVMPILIHERNLIMYL